MSSITVPTVITKEQYKNAVFAKNRENGDEFIIWDNGSKNLWVGRDNSQSTWNNWNPQSNDDTWFDTVEITDENGDKIEVEAIVCDTCNGNNLDLEELAKGKISWI